MNITQALVDGLIWSLLWVIVIAVAAWRFPQQLVHDYPEEIQKVVHLPPVDKQKYRRFIVPAFTAIIGFLFFSVLRTYSAAEVAIWVLMLHAFILGMVWNVFDLLILDWLLFCTIQPKFMVLPGSEGHPAYKDYRFHFNGFLKGCAYSAVGAVICGGICFGILKLFIW